MATKNSTLFLAKGKIINLMMAKIKAGDDSPVTRKEISERLKLHDSYISFCMSLLVQQGVARKLRRGEWLLNKEYLKEISSVNEITK